MRNLQDFPGELLSIIASNLDRSNIRTFRTLCRSCCMAAWPHFKHQFRWLQLSLDTQALQWILQLSKHEHLAKLVNALTLQLDDHWDRAQTTMDLRNGVTIFNIANILKAFVNIKYIRAGYYSESYVDELWQSYLPEVPLFRHNTSITVVAEAYFEVLIPALRMSQASISTLDLDSPTDWEIALPLRLVEHHGNFGQDMGPPAITLHRLSLAVDPNDTFRPPINFNMHYDTQIQQYTKFFNEVLHPKDLQLYIHAPESLEGALAEIDLVHAVLENCRFRRLLLRTNTFPLPISSLMRFLKAHEGVLELLEINWLDVYLEDYEEMIGLFEYLQEESVRTLGVILTYVDMIADSEMEHRVFAYSNCKNEELEKAINYFKKRLELHQT